MDEIKVVQCKRITVDRFVQATLYSILAQVAPVTVFLLLVNTNVFHPITWLLDTLRLVCSVYTWLCTVPLVLAVGVHSAVWSKVFLARANYFHNRFLLFLNTYTKKATLLLTHALVGFCTAWIFVKILDWRAAIRPEARLCLLLCGVFMGSFHFLGARMRLVQDVEFPLIQQRRFLRIRAQLVRCIFRGCFVSALMPSLVFLGAALLLSPFALSGFSADNLSVSAVFGNWRLLLYVWILAAQILGSLQLTEELFKVLLTEALEFPIQGPALTLADALNADQFKVVRLLASLDLFALSEGRNRQRRKELFSLSIPGGHPYNWRSAFEACTGNVAAFTAQLAVALRNVQEFEKSKTQSPGALPMQQQQQQKVRSASQLAEKILQRQQNEHVGIRNMSHTFPGDSDEASADRRPRIFHVLPPPQQVQNGLENCVRQVRERLMALRGVNYLLAEQHYARVHFVLRDSQRISWLLQGIAALACCSIEEDEYGVVQKSLPALVAQLLELKAVADQVESVCLDRARMRSHQKALRSAVRRSLYNIASTFGEYLNDLILPDADREALQSYVMYREN